MKSVACVNRNGEIDDEGYPASSREIGIRPVLWIELE